MEYEGRFLVGMALMSGSWFGGVTIQDESGIEKQ